MVRDDQVIWSCGDGIQLLLLSNSVGGTESMDGHCGVFLFDEATR